MTELYKQIPALAEVEPVRAIRSPSRLDYEFTAGVAQTRFLLGMKEKRILGETCPVCNKVYLPPRGACPIDGVATTDQVELPPTGTVTTFCVVNLDFTGLGQEIPYVSASVLVDGSDIPVFSLISEIPYNEVRMGLRVEVVWVPDEELDYTQANIAYFKPTGEPDADFETYKEHV